MLSQDRNSQEDIKPQKESARLFHEDLCDDGEVFVPPRMFQMERTIILEQIPEHFNVQRVGLDGVAGRKSRICKRAQQHGEAHRDKLFFCHTRPGCGGQRKSTGVHHKIELRQIQRLDGAQKLLSAEDAFLKGGLKAKHRDKAQEKPGIKLLEVDIGMIELLKGTRKQGEERHISFVILRCMPDKINDPVEDGESLHIRIGNHWT